MHQNPLGSCLIQLGNWTSAPWYSYQRLISLFLEKWGCFKFQGWDWASQDWSSVWTLGYLCWSACWEQSLANSSKFLVDVGWGMPCLAKYDGYYYTKHQIFPINFICGFFVRPLYRANFEIKVMVTCYLQSVPIEWKKIYVSLFQSDWPQCSKNAVSVLQTLLSKLHLSTIKKTTLNILHDLSGIIKPGRFIPD